MKTIQEMALEADIEWDLIDEDEGQVWYITKAGLERFAALVREDAQRKPLSDEEIASIIVEMNGNEPTAMFWRDLVRAAEAAHSIKE